MGQAYEEKTEHLIEMFMKYSDKKSLDVNEFLKIRKQAIKETDDIVFNGTNIIRPLSDTKIPQEEKRTNKKENSRVDSNNHKKQSITKPIEKEKAETHTEELESDEFTKEDIFLAMIKDVED